MSKIFKSKFSGAGIMIVEYYNNSLCFTFFQHRNNQFMDVGGLIDKNESPIETAIRECREESANLLNFKASDLNHKIIIGSYVSFFVYVSGIY